MLAWPERGYEKETTGFPLKFAEDATGKSIGGKAYADIPFQLICSASETQARGSWNLVQNTGSWVFSAEVDVWLSGLGIRWRGDNGERAKLS